MENVRLSSMISYDNWVKNLNKNTKFSEESKIKPKAPATMVDKNSKQPRRAKKLATSELWLG